VIWGVLHRDAGFHLLHAVGVAGLVFGGGEADEEFAIVNGFDYGVGSGVRDEGDDFIAIEKFFLRNEFS